MNERLTLQNKIIIYILLAILAVIILFPFYWIFLTSIKNSTDITGHIPKFLFEPTLINYVKIFSTSTESTMDFPQYYLNSLIIAGGGTLLSLIIGGCAGYALTRVRFKKESNRETIAFTLLSFWFGPELAIILPLYTVFNKLGFIDNHIVLIFTYQLIGVPFVVWLSRSFFKEVPVSLEEAARVDGYSPWNVFWKITFPLVKTGIGATAILTFIFQWNNFIFPLIIAGKDTIPVTTGCLGFISYEAVLWGQMAAAIMVASIPQLILALLVQKQMVRGLTFGAVKG